LHQVGTYSLLIYMMHGHTYIKLRILKEQTFPLKTLDFKVEKYGKLIYLLHDFA